MLALISGALGALIVTAIGLPVLLIRRNTITKIIASGDSNRIPEGKRAKYEKKGIKKADLLKQYEKDNMNFAIKHPFIWVIICAILCFVLFAFQASIR